MTYTVEPRVDADIGSPPGPCAGGSITVVPGRSTQVDVFCNAR